MAQPTFDTVQTSALNGATVGQMIERLSLRGIFDAPMGRYLIRTVLIGLIAIPILAMLVALGYATYRENEASIEDAYRIAAAIDDSTAAQTEEFLPPDLIPSTTSRKPCARANA